MSADNYYEINPEQRKDGSFRFGVNMGFASDEREEPVPNGPRTAWFDDLDGALRFAEGEYAEYGYSIVRNKAWEAYEGQQASQVSESTAAREAELRAEGAAAERERISKLLSLLADYRSEYGTKEDLDSSNHSLREMAISMSISIDTMRIAARIVASNDLEEAKGYLPSWRWGGAELKELGFTQK